MNNALKSLENNALAALSARAPTGVVNAIKTASAKTGVSFSYLMEKASAESSFNPTAKAKTSSATGLFQFIESTWMDMVDRHGAKHGINPDQPRENLLNLRKDPEIASIMAAEFADDNAKFLEQTVGGDIGNTELYFAHFMGAGGASAFLSQHQKDPLSIGADLFPKAASANRNVFYDSKTGAPKTLEAIYNFFDKKFTNEDATPTTMAHKPESAGIKEGYNYLSPSMKKPIEIVENYSAYSAQENSYNSLYQLESRIQAFFSQPIGSVSDMIPTSLYGNLSSPTSMLLSILED